MPRSPRKKCAELLQLFHRSNLSPMVSPNHYPSVIETTSLPWNALSPENTMLVKSFFTPENVSWTSPMARDYVRIKRSAEKMLRFSLTCTLKDAHAFFSKSILMSMSVFQSFFAAYQNF